MSIDIQILSIPGCEATLPTIELVNTVVRELNAKANLEHRLITEHNQAVKERFMGSPTVRINGVDIEIGARDGLSFGIT